MAFQPASAHLKTRVVSTGPTTVAVVSQNFLKATTRSKTSLTQIESLRASYPLKLMSPASVNTALSPSPSAAASPTIPDAHANSETTTTLTTTAGTATPGKPLPPPPRIVYMITYGGGLLADDHPDLQFVLARHAKLLVLGQGNTKIYKSPRADYPPASQTLHSTVGPGGVFLFLGPAVVACEDSSVFLRHEILLQAQRSRRHLSAGARGAGAESMVRDQMERLRLLEGRQGEEEDLEEELPNCVVLDWIAGGRGEEERWKARRAEWRLVVRWAELEPESEASSNTTGSDQPKAQEISEGEEEEFVEEEDPRDVADRAAGGPVIFRDGFLIEHNPPMPSSKSKTSSPSSSSPAGSATPTSTSQQQPSAVSTTQKPTLAPKMTSYAPSLYPHSTIGSLFIMGPKTERLQQYILKRFEHITIYPGQKPELRPDYPVLWSATIVQIPRPSAASDTTFVPRRKRMMMKAMVVKMASQGIEQMQDFLKSLFEEHELQESKSNKLMDDSDHEEEDAGEIARRMKKSSTHGSAVGIGQGGDVGVEGLSVIDQLFGGRATWERAFR
ncbi:hypothetical protein BG015_008675 [Linnemannia schmuckeri]|uniref:Uncharacterized protein n=1 Tax=Linnemannia schmuckeri TaxID=64567 RepID=A0A9P5S064_9FUNG|nr:hypothetical protein BG015_008675 [Linnemannia schmuckeri]